MVNYLKKLEQVKTGKEFYELVSKITDAGYVFQRKRGSCKDIYALRLADKDGRTLEEDRFNLYKGVLNNEACISYFVKDKHHSIGKCQLRNCSKSLKLVSKEEQV